MTKKTMLGSIYTIPATRPGLRPRSRGRHHVSTRMAQEATEVFINPNPAQLWDALQVLCRYFILVTVLLVPVQY